MGYGLRAYRFRAFGTGFGAFGLGSSSGLQASPSEVSGEEYDQNRMSSAGSSLWPTQHNGVVTDRNWASACPKLARHDFGHTELAATMTKTTDSRISVTRGSWVNVRISISPQAWQAYIVARLQACWLQRVTIRKDTCRDNAGQPHETARSLRLGFQAGAQTPTPVLTRPA